MLKFKVILDNIEETDEDLDKIEIDLTDLDPNAKNITLTFKDNLPADVIPEDNVKFNIIGSTIKRYIIGNVIDTLIHEHMENIEVDEKDIQEILQSKPKPDPNRQSELDVIYMLMKKNDIKGYLRKVKVNDEVTESPQAISEFSYKKLGKIIVSGEPYIDEVQFEDTLDLNYELYFDSMKISRENGKYSISEIEEE